MEVGAIADTQQSVDSLVAENVAPGTPQPLDNLEVIDTADSLEVFSYKHENGLVVSATVKEMGGCALLGSLSEKQMAILARGYMMEQQRLLQNEGVEESEDSEEVNEEIGDEPEQQTGAEKLKQKSSSVERTEQRVSEKKTGDASEAIEHIASQEVSAPVSNNAAGEALNAKPGVSQTQEPIQPAGEAPSKQLSKPSTSGSLQEIKTGTTSISETHHDIAKPSRLTTRKQAGDSAKSTRIIQEISKLPLPELAKNIPSVITEQIEGSREPLDMDFSSEIEDEVLFDEQSQETVFSREEYRIPPVDDVELSAEELVGFDAEILSDNKLVERSVDWSSGEVLRLRDFDAEIGLNTQPVLFREADQIEVLNDLPIKGAEESIVELSERIDVMGAEGVETIYEILDEIALRVEELGDASKIEAGETASHENNEANREDLVVIEEELKELFIELFDYVEMEYTPELIDSLIKLAVRLDISELVPKLTEESNIVPEGTHEVIKQMLGALTAIKQAAKRAYYIGKSVLVLYLQQLTTA